MSGHPSAADLIDSVRGFLAEFESELSGRQAFHARVAGNVLALVERELRQRPEAVEAEALSGLLGRTAPLAELRADVCAALRDRSLDERTPGLLEALLAATVAKLAVDNPKFSTYRRLTEPQP